MRTSPDDRRATARRRWSFSGRRRARGGRISAALLSVFCVSLVAAQAQRREPRIGYVYPAGGRRGETIEVLVGGQSLRNVTGALVSGKGVSAELIKHYKPLRTLTKEQRQALIGRLRDLIAQRWDKLVRDGSVKGKLPGIPGIGRAGRRRMKGKRAASESAMVELPEHPLLRNMDDMDLRELLHVRAILVNAREHRQQNNQLAETVLLKITLDSHASVGDRELRLVTRTGLTNPRVFQVGTMRETRELESNDPGGFNPLPPEPPLKLPVVINGQIMPSDVDRFRFAAKKGQRLVIQAHARRLIPFLADAVPGWFQATLSLYDAGGNEVAFDDDYRFEPDPIILYEVPEDGEYAVQIRDAIYRGREDFVYRVSISEQPFVTWTFPVGARAGHGRYADVGGWNVPVQRMYLTSHSGWEGVRQKVWGRSGKTANPVLYDVSKLPCRNEVEDNDTPAAAQAVEPPLVIDGRIERADDVDVFSFAGRSGEDLVVEVLARRLSSPLDSAVWLLDGGGEVLAWNDDYEHKDGFLFTDAGRLTHHADSYLRATLPADGTYYVRLADVQRHGGEAYAYRLRISPPRPNFAVWLTPSSVNVPLGRAAPLTAHVVRRDGFDAPIELRLKDGSSGFTLDGGRIPAGCDRIRMTLSAPRRRSREPVVLHVEASAEIAGRRVTRAVGPADDDMQAFLYRHLTPAREMVVEVIGGWRFGARVELDADEPVRIPIGGVARVRVSLNSSSTPDGLRLELSDPPAGITLDDVITGDDEIVLVLKARGNEAKIGVADNLIVEAFGEINARRRKDGDAGKKQSVYLGALPAIPIEIVSERTASRSGRASARS